jgi:hypothetical protein
MDHNLPPLWKPFEARVLLMVLDLSKFCPLSILYRLAGICVVVKDRTGFHDA